MSYKVKEIEDAKSEVQVMKNNLQYFKNEDRKQREIKRINAFIRLINASERLVQNSIDRDVVDSLLLYVFKMEYEKAQYNDVDGFVSLGVLEMIKKTMAFSVGVGRESFKRDIAVQMAGDMLGNAKFLNEEEKIVNIHENKKVAALMKDAIEYWENNLEVILNACHSRRKGIWKS